MAEQTKPWHSLTVEQVLAELKSRPTGLSPEEASERLARFGPNALKQAPGKPAWVLFLEQFKNVLIIILIFAVVISALLGDELEAALILTVVLFAAGLGFIQEYRAEKAVEALARMAAPAATVLRGGVPQEVASAELVPGDVVLLSSGDRVPADCRLLEAANLKADEAPLTGESVPVEKLTAPIPGENLPVGDRRNMAYSGTAVVYGRGKAVVVATGMATEFGRIAGLLQAVEVGQTPLQRSLARLGRWIAVGALFIVAVIFVLGVLRGKDVLEMFIWAVSLAVAAVPEALPAVVTITLALGVQRMVKRHVLIRRLPAVETLGSTTFICSDKTGTLTQDQMTVRQIYVDGESIAVIGVGYEPKGEFTGSATPIALDNHPVQMLLRIAALCNDSQLVNNSGVYEIRGDPTEGALVVAAAKAGMDREALEREFPRVGEVPFSSERKRMTTLHRTPQGPVAFSKGAPEVILDSCSLIYHQGQERPLTEQDRETILGRNRELAEGALRVLAFAYKPLASTGEDPALEQDMVFMGLTGMMDPPREEVKEAIRKCQSAGIKSVMITGDHKLTAVAIARELGMLHSGLALSGTELDQLSDEKLLEQVEEIEVYARVSPAHKYRVVEALGQRGHVVAMTGDGVNDAPALKKADIGVAMGITGTDVTKEAAAMILTDDNFASIVAAVEEGRAVFSNIRKTLIYLFSTNLGELLLVLGTVLLHLPLPLTAIQLLFINLVTDGLPALALAVDPADPDIMKRSPRPPRQFILARPHLALVAVGGAWQGAVSLALFIWALNSGREAQAISLVFLTVIFIQYFKAFVFRSDRHSIFRIGPFTNRWLVLAVVFNILLMLPTVYIGPLQGPFGTFPLGLWDWALVIGLALTAVPVLEMTKYLLRHTK